MRKYLILVAMLAMVLTACRVESIVTLDIDEDGSALVGAELGYDEEFRQLLGDAGANPDDLFSDLPEFGGDDIVQTERTEGDMTYVGAASRVEDLSQFGTTQAATDVFSSFSYTFDEDSASLDATVSSDTIGEAGGDLPIDPSELTDDFFRATVVVTMPGTVTEHNADEVRPDGALVWDLPLTGGDVRVQAASEIGGGGASNLLIVLLAVVLGLAIIAIIAATVMNRRRSEQAVASAAAAHDGSATLEMDAAMPADAIDEAADTAEAADAATESSDVETTIVDVDLEPTDEDGQPDNT